MRINQISTVNGLQHYQKNNESRKNVNFGVRFLVENNVGKFMLKEGANLYHRMGPLSDMGVEIGRMQFLSLFKELYDKITPMEPKNLAIKMNLTNEALRYAILGDVDGNMFDKNKDVYSLSAEFANPYGMMGRTVVTGKILNSSEESFNEIMNNVKDICDMYEKVTKGF